MCDIAKCKQPVYLAYAALPDGGVLDVCWNHWEKHCDDKNKFDLRKYHSKSTKGSK